ncbi:hypothetical protein PTTG_25597 [Puccinia triticina 1-1 BBBD Race 1]|uniref:CxC1 domain-containing protein n=1 Tax=Puccinia triticina (isolate 1-1 / race 1 (BBBD)) TaxID=630390 RepID=A0A180H0M0_PUCT1|nr:hypothetical protein PTTG_25597 [Puccinia triticina 1-1 BBBD Race 1]
MPSSSRALKAHLCSQQAGQTSNLANFDIDPTEPLPQAQLWDDSDPADWETFEEPTRPITSLTQQILYFNSAQQKQQMKKTGIESYPNFIGLLETGYMGSSPVQPQTAFSICLLQFHNLAWQWCNVAILPFTEMLAGWLEERSERLLNEERTKAKMRKPFSAAVNTFRHMLQKTNNLVNTALQLTKTQVLARSSCPGCFGPTPENDSYASRSSLKNSLIICLDGNFQHRCHAKAGGQAIPLVIPPIFLEPESVEKMWSEIENLGRPDRDYFAFPHKKEQVNFGTSVFHAYVHEWKCQVEYNPRFKKGWGLSDGEGCERLWSSLSPIIQKLRYSSRNHCFGALSHLCQFHNAEGLISLILWLRKKFDAAKLARRAAKEHLNCLIQLPNPFNENGSFNYTQEFFKTQWENQVNHLKQLSDEDSERRENLNKLLEKEEALRKLCEVVQNARWALQANAIDRLADDINKAELSQQELANQLGIEYAGLGTNVEKEKMKLLVWGVKRSLYAKAVEIMGVQQPIIESRTVVKLIAKFNKQNRLYLMKFDPNVLADPSYQLLTGDLFVSMELDDAFWSEAHFYHLQAPWAISLDVRAGIRASLMVDRAEEELDLIAQELGRAMTWAVEYHNLLLDLATRIQNLPPGSNEVVTPARVGTFDTQSGQQVLMYNLTSDDVPPVGDKADEALQEQAFLDNAEDGEEAEDGDVNLMKGNNNDTGDTAAN